MQSQVQKNKDPLSRAVAREALPQQEEAQTHVLQTQAQEQAAASPPADPGPKGVPSPPGDHPGNPGKGKPNFPAMSRSRERFRSDQPVQRNKNTGTSSKKKGEGGEAESLSQTAKRPSKVYDISQGLKADEALRRFLAGSSDWQQVNVSMHGIAQGTLWVRSLGETGGSIESREGQSLNISQLPFLSVLMGINLIPVLKLSNLGSAESLKASFGFTEGGGAIQEDPLAFMKRLTQQGEALGLQGLGDFNLSNVSVGFEGGAFRLIVNNLQVQVGGFLEASGSFGFDKGEFLFDVEADVDLSESTQGSLKIQKDGGGISGEGKISINMDHVSGSIEGSFRNGKILIEGTVTYESEKFTGSLTLIAAEKETADRIMYTRMGLRPPNRDLFGVGSIDDEETPKKTTKDDFTLVGFGTLNVQFTDWLAGEATVGMDSDSHVTVLGEIGTTEPIVLLEQKKKTVELLDVGFKLGYGIPLVGQAYLGAGVSLDLTGGFGPLTLREAKISGQYSTRPDIATKLAITAALNLNAFAEFGLSAYAKVGVEIFGHDFAAGLNLRGAAGAKAYADAGITLDYYEAPNPGGKVGEAWLNGSFDAAALFYLSLNGSFFTELDSPFWSPAPDYRKDWPIFSLEYPLGEIGIGGDVKWKIGSDEPPEFKTKPVSFDSKKFIADMSKEPKGKKGKGETEKAGTFTPGGKGGMSGKPGVKDAGGNAEAGIDEKDLEKEQKKQGGSGQGAENPEGGKPHPFKMGNKSYSLLLDSGKKRKYLVIDHSKNKVVDLLNKTRDSVEHKKVHKKKLGKKREGAIRALRGLAKEAKNLEARLNKKKQSSKQQKKGEAKIKKLAKNIESFARKYRFQSLLGYRKGKKAQEKKKSNFSAGFGGLGKSSLKSGNLNKFTVSNL